MYKTIYLDPPWFEQGGGKIKRGADRHYKIMKTKDIITLLQKDVLPIIDDNAHLYLWVTNNFMQDGFKVIEALGFRYITCITWMKDRTGLGQYYRGLTEHCLFAVKGKTPYKIINGKRQQGVTGFIEKKTTHSTKPETMRNMIETVSYAPYLEYFARERHKNWTCKGDEITTQDIMGMCNLKS